MKVLAPAKINLCLDIVGRREDGYHEIETLFQTVSLYDSLDISWKSGGGKDGGMKAPISLKVDSGNDDCPQGPENIVWQAARSFQRDFDPGGTCRIRLKKNIPVQAGLGGGSSDAAAVLIAARKTYIKGHGISGKDPSLDRIALSLGADVPYFLKGGCAFASGVGEKIVPLSPAPQFWAVLVKPEVGLSTREVYRWHDEYRGKGRKTSGGSGLTPGSKNNKMMRLIVRGKPLQVWSRYLFNCFEEVVFQKIPELCRIKERLIRSGAENALLSGSGSALYGIVSSRSQGESIKRKMRGLGVRIWVVHSI